MTSPCISLLYVHSDSIGYGRYGSYLAREIAKQDITVYDHLPGLDAEQEKATAHLNTGHRKGVAKVVAWISTPTHATGWYEG